MIARRVSDELWKAFLVEYVKAGGRMRDALEAIAPALIAQGRMDALSIARRTLVWSADQEAKFVDALRDAGLT